MTDNSVITFFFFLFDGITEHKSISFHRSSEEHVLSYRRNESLSCFMGLCMERKSKKSPLNQSLHSTACHWDFLEQKCLRINAVFKKPNKMKWPCDIIFQKVKNNKKLILINLKMQLVIFFTLFFL